MPPAGAQGSPGRTPPVQVRKGVLVNPHSGRSRTTYLAHLLAATFHGECGRGHRYGKVFIARYLCDKSPCAR
ncbi:hypothetical protein [Ktedonobacter sp. SOSP1-52]|uniref:hypothetical protein n=1 Tax=Ktedonobacter sp. SOSP1-52 TaxID=2778366 RepID=UPI00191685F3|nr:hypothetical protein [Ktedonobacter sp. SOSP1-52]